MMYELVLVAGDSAHHAGHYLADAADPSQVRYLADVVNPGQGVEPPGAGKLKTVVQWVAWVVLALCVTGVLVVAGRMALSHQRGQGGEHATGLAYVLGACVLVGIASGLVGTLVGGE
ncbi:hypothetical protein [Streptomyces sp. WMMC940]|uniref:hypothetical protein n=1 Tax=Streptomyces sp. WMMC940 TaxID=3015153 RepID=UPI0022B6ABFD|nr:hypothetical protein [Streptomyces sp. WMMC940]MCZ7458208.1 hypothetical protein [Streptomyces sp. WMMC940]